MNRNTKILLGVLGLGALAYFIFKPKAKLSKNTPPNTPKNTPPNTYNLPITYPDGYKEGDYVLFKLKIGKGEIPFIYLLKGGKAYQFKNIKDFDEKKYGSAKPILMVDISKIPKADTYA
jgi:hypothetical protein